MSGRREAPLPDLLEMREASAERMLDEMTEGVPQDHFRCACGRIVPFTDGETLSPDPFALPYCPECVEAAANERTTP